MMSLSDTQGAVAADIVVDGGNSSNNSNQLDERNDDDDRNIDPSSDPLRPVQVGLPDPPRAAILQHTVVDAKLYWDRSHYSSPAEQMTALENSSTVYVGNLSFTIKKHHVHHHFTTLLSSSSSNGTSSFHIVKRVILGIDRFQKKPCGFCFVELYHRSDAIRAVSMISGTQLDGKVIRVELDAGFQPGRQLGRGVSGGQVRDEKRKQLQQRNENMKRYRYDGDDRSSSTQPPSVERPVRLDEALPSTRNHGDYSIITNATNTNHNNSTEATTTNATANEDDMVDEDQPRAKRIKLE
jgi:nuclear cap-binding protein subunit 2